MQLAEAVLANLAHVAHADGHFADVEAELIDHYGKALGVSRDFLDRLKREPGTGPVPMAQLDATPAERQHIVEMLIRLAVADGRLRGRERGILLRVARSLDVGKLQVASIVVRVEREARRQQPRRTRFGAIAAASGLAVAVCVLVVWRILADVQTRAEQTHVAGVRNAKLIEHLQVQIDEQSRARATADARRVRDTQLGMQRAAEQLAERIRVLEQRAAAPGDAGLAPPDQPASVADARAEIDQLIEELRQLRDTTRSFRELERRYAPSVLYVLTLYTMRGPAPERRHLRRSNVGTAFYVTVEGHLVTNKHVVRSWLFNADDVKRRAAGWEVDPATVAHAVWPSGVDVLTAEGRYDLSTGYSTRNGTLRLFATAPDRFVDSSRKLSTGESYRARYHALDTSDLAVLLAEVENAVVPLPLAPDDHVVQKLDRVMALGFPAAISIRESARIDPAPSLGEVRTIKESIFISAPIVGGNSGGPLFDRRGFVLGVAYATYGASTLGGCIPVRHIRPLLP